MLQHDKLILAQVAVEKSDEALKTSYKTLDINLNTAQNRAYYAIFYLVSALSYIDDFVSKSHHFLQGQFNKRYVYEQKLFESSLSKIYKTLIANREFSDYNFTAKLNREGVLKDIEDAKNFIETVKPYVLKRLKETE